MSTSEGTEIYGVCKVRQSLSRNVAVETLREIVVGEKLSNRSSHSGEEVQSDSHSMLAAAYRVGELYNESVSTGVPSPALGRLKNNNSGNMNFESKFASCRQVDEPNNPMLECKSVKSHDESMVITVEPVEGNDDLGHPENALEKKDQWKGSKRTYETSDVEDEVETESNLPVDEDISITNRRTICQSVRVRGDSTKYNTNQCSSNRRGLKHDRSKDKPERTYETTGVEKVAKRFDSKLKSTEVNHESHCTGRHNTIMKNLQNTNVSADERQKVEKSTKFRGRKYRGQSGGDKPESSGISRYFCEVRDEYSTSLIAAKHYGRVEAVDTLLQLQETLRTDKPKRTVEVSESNDTYTQQQSDSKATDNYRLSQHPRCEMAADNGQHIRGVNFGSGKLTLNRNSISTFSNCVQSCNDDSMIQNAVPSSSNSSQNTIDYPVKIINPQGDYSEINDNCAYSLPNQPLRPTPIYVPTRGFSKSKSSLPTNMILAESGESAKLICCDKCRAFFNSFLAIDSHNRKVHNYLTTCKVCHKGFKTTSNLERHNRIHEGKRDFKCFCCAREFSRKDHLACHILTHPVKCPICSEEFKERTSLASHCGVKHRLEVWFCNYCNKALPSNDECEEHVRSHASSSTSSTGDKPRLNEAEETAEIAPLEELDGIPHNAKKSFKAQWVNTSVGTNSRVESKAEVTDTTAVDDSVDAINTQRAIITDEFFRISDRSQSEVKKYGCKAAKELTFKDLSVVHGQDEAFDNVNCSEEVKLLNKVYDMANKRHSDLIKNCSAMSDHRVIDDERNTVNHEGVENAGERHHRKKLKQRHPKMILKVNAKRSVGTFSGILKTDKKPNTHRPERFGSTTKQVVRGPVSNVSNSRPVIAVLGTIIEGKHVTGLVTRKTDELPVNCRSNIATGVLGLPSAFKVEVGSQTAVVGQYQKSSFSEPLRNNQMYNMAPTVPYYPYYQGTQQNINQGTILMNNNAHGLDHVYENLLSQGQPGRRCRICSCVFPSDQLYAVHYLAYHCRCHLATQRPH